MKVFNRKYQREYQKLESYEAGIALIGSEVKTAKEGHIKLEDSFVKLVGTDVMLINAEIQIYKYSRPADYDPRRSRRLLLHKKEIVRLRTKLASGDRLTLIPISCYNKGPLIKLEIALSRGRQDLEKRKLVKQRDIKIAENREAKEYMKY